MKWFATAFVIIVACFAIVLNSKPYRLKQFYTQYRYTPSQYLRSKYVRQAKRLMSTKSLKYVLEQYRDERDVEFTVGMISVSRTGKDTALLWQTVRNNPPGTQVRVVCMAQLLQRGFFDVWDEIQKGDIDMLATSMPIHICHWRNILIQYSGRPSRYLAHDTFPERYKFKALFRECIEKYHIEETKRLMKEG